MTDLVLKFDIQPNMQQVRVHYQHLIELDEVDSLALRANNGVFEPDETAICRKLINCGDRVLDVGANIGYYTLLFSDLVSPNGRVTAIEPDQQNFSYLQRNLAKQVARDIVSLHQVALGNDNNNSRLFRSEENLGMHRLYPSVCCRGTSIEVPVIKGDSLELGSLDFIKIDIEGYEPAALHGLSATLKQSPNVKILCEFSPLSLWEAGFSPLVFFEEMRAYGFHLIVRDNKTWRVVSFDEVIFELQKIPISAVPKFIGTLKHADDNQVISQKVKAFLAEHGYKRPLLENMLLVAPGAWQTVRTTLGFDRDSGIPTDTVTNKKWKLRWVSLHDKSDLLSLFASAFGQPMARELWTWKYAGLAAQGIVAHSKGRAIAYYGGIPRMLWLQGRELPAVQICDVMVAPQVRGILTRRGAFAQTAETFLRTQTGSDKAYRLAFGFPNGRAARLGEKLGMYARDDTFFEASWRVASSMRLPFWLKVEPLKQSNFAVLDRLWQEMKQSLVDYVLPQKDAVFFRWRYVEHPLNSYNIYLVSWRGINKVIGVVVLRDHGSEQGMELMDFIGRPRVFNLLLNAAKRIAVRMSRQRVFGWMTTHIISMLPNPSTKFELSGVYIDPPALKKMADKHLNRWWFLGGDTDFR